MNFHLLYRTSDDGYLYLGSDFKLYFCDHSGDGRHDISRPDTCDDVASPLDIKHLKSLGKMVFIDAISAKREDGFTVLLSHDVFRKAMELVRVLNLN